MTPAIRNKHYNGWMPSIFNDLFDTAWPATADVTTPAINVKENDHSYCVEVAAAGMNKADFDIHLDENDNLVISMEKKSEQQSDDNTRYLRREFAYSKFARTLILPDDVDKDAIKATMTDGILTIELPKYTDQQKQQLRRSITIG